MARIKFDVEERVCDECSLALRRFLSGIEGVESVNVGERDIEVVFDPEKVSGGAIAEIARDSLEKLGHKLAA